MELLIKKLPRDIYRVIGIPRSGLLPATIIATELNAYLSMDGKTFVRGSRLTGVHMPGQESMTLLVDDTYSTGRAMSLFIQGCDCDIDYNAALYVAPGREKDLDFFGKIVDHPRIFEWNLFNSMHMKYALLDMDGVICYDPDHFDNDGEEYRRAIINAKPLHLPMTGVRAIVTGRLERWRPETEAWLAKYEVKYDHLYMAPYETAVERRKHSMAAFKAEKLYENTGCFFVESEPNQAYQIATMSGMNVICSTTMKHLKV